MVVKMLRTIASLEEDQYSVYFFTDGAYTTSSLILRHQLDDKLRAHQYYIKFLKSVGIWERVSEHGF